MATSDRCGGQICKMCQIFLGFYTPNIIKSVNFRQSYWKNNKVDVFGTQSSSPVIESQGHRSRSKVSAEMCVLPKCPLRRSVIAVSFRCDVIGCQLARKGVRRGATEASGGVERMWAW